MTFEEDWSKKLEVFEDFKQLTPYKHISRIELIAQDEKPDLEGGEDNDEDYDDYIENEIYIRDATVILSNGCDFESKIVDKCYSFDSPVIDV